MISSQARGQIDLTNLENIAATSQKKPIQYIDSESAGLFNYLNNMGITSERFNAAVQKANSRGHVFIGDLGGGFGKASYELSSYGFYAFNIKNSYNITKNQLPSNRVIVADLNQMPEIPDNSFHILISHNALGMTDLRRSLQEADRILKPKGTAFL